MQALEKIIIREIENQGPMTFARFMELALYHPEHGYYSSPGTKIGRSGDFYTAPTVNPIFGAMLARQLHQMWVWDGRPARWPLVEFGPGTGALARDITGAIGHNYPDFFEALSYYLIEISPALRKSQQALLADMPGGKFSWVNSLAEMRPYPAIGCVLANELVDAFPVHLVIQKEAGLQELYISFDGNLVMVEGPPSTDDLVEYLAMQHVTLGPGQRAEVNLQARGWLADVATYLERGFLMTIDYGATMEELYAPHRRNGTLRCFHQHRLVDNPLLNIGGQDITAHVNFSALGIWGEQLGLTKLGLATQPDFLLSLGILNVLENQKDYDYNPDILKKTSAIKQLVLPGGMGDIFKVLIQSKGYAQPPRLSGLKRSI